MAARPWDHSLRNELRRARAGETVPGTIRVRTITLSAQIALRSLAIGSPVPPQLSSVRTLSRDTQESTTDPTEGNQHATKIGSDPLHNIDQHSPCTCVTCQREPHGTFNMGGEYVDQQHGHNQGSYRGAGEGPSGGGLKRPPALRGSVLPVPRLLERHLRPMLPVVNLPSVDISQMEHDIQAAPKAKTFMPTPVRPQYPRSILKKPFRGIRLFPFRAPPWSLLLCPALPAFRSALLSGTGRWCMGLPSWRMRRVAALIVAAVNAQCPHSEVELVQHNRAYGAINSPLILMIYSLTSPSLSAISSSSTMKLLSLFRVA
jgi:hypothetical protein